MTKPTGRPKGRPPADPYTSFTARLREDVAARIVSHANRRGLPLSALLRRWWEEGLAREESVLVSDDKEAPALVYDIKEDIPLMMSNNKEEAPIVLDIKEDMQPSILSDTKEAQQAQRDAATRRVEGLHLAGLSMQKIADRLNEEGMPTRSGDGLWGKGSVERELKKHLPALEARTNAEQHSTASV